MYFMDEVQLPEKKNAHSQNWLQKTILFWKISMNGNCKQFLAEHFNIITLIK